MAAGKMHSNEVDIDTQLVRRLVLTQFPHFGDRPLEKVQSAGTVNAIYRLGDDLCVRLPLVASWAGDIEKEIEWLPKLARRLPLLVPEPVAKGEPGSGYPFQWAIYRWIEGEPFARDLIDDESLAATDLAHFVAALRQIDLSGAPSTGRKPLLQLDDVTRAAIDSLRDVIDTDATTVAWEASLEAQPWDGRPVWLHCDLLPSNLLVEGGRLRAVIDFGAAGIGDPAQDLVPAWSVFGEIGRGEFRGVLGVDDETWARARGFALHQALLIIPYYPETNPGFVTMAIRTVSEVLDDLSA
jgi:aminoglycoside phosphotransferase (APT) family kinase protein